MSINKEDLERLEGKKVDSTVARFQEMSEAAKEATANLIKAMEAYNDLTFNDSDEDTLLQVVELSSGIANHVIQNVIRLKYRR